MNLLKSLPLIFLVIGSFGPLTHAATKFKDISELQINEDIEVHYQNGRYRIQLRDGKAIREYSRLFGSTPSCSLSIDQDSKLVKVKKVLFGEKYVLERGTVLHLDKTFLLPKSELFFKGGVLLYCLNNADSELDETIPSESYLNAFGDLLSVKSLETSSKPASNSGSETPSPGSNAF